MNGLDSNARSPFVPVRKHASALNTPPSSPSPLQSSSIHNVPQPLPTLSFLPPSPQQQLSNTTSAPRIRAKLTPNATPRKKVLLPGAEYADLPPPRVPPPSSASPLKAQYASPTAGRGLPSWPPASPPQQHHYQPPAIARSAFMPSLNNLEDGETYATRGLAGLGIGGSYETSRPARQSKMGNGGKDNVLVCVRVRPPAGKLTTASALSDVAWTTSPSTGKVSLNGTLPGGPGEFTFDAVVTGTDNEGVYDAAGRDLVLAAMEGFDAVLFAYGQTASGKTFTLTGNPANPGIIPQSVSEIFSYIREHPEQEFLLRASYLEIYNESLKDLLAPETGPLKIRQDEKKKFFVDPLREEVVTNEFQVAALLKRGEQNRHVGRTDFNERSSRSHSVFQITIESRQDDGTTPLSSTPSRALRPNEPRLSGASVKISKLSLIDLAGSEQATSQTERRSEGAFINKSLLTLEKVIASLTEGGKTKPHVPYRDSKLTQILQPSLAGDARVAVIATMNPSPTAIEETKSTLKFAQRVKKVTLSAKINEVVDDKALIVKYRTQIEELNQRLKEAEAVAAEAVTSAQSSGPRVSRGGRDGRIADLRSEMDEIKALFLRADNVADRRKSMLPPRPVSPLKPRVGLAPTTEEDESDRSSSPTWEEQFHSSQETLSSLEAENTDLKRRLAELEEDRLKSAELSGEEKLVELMRENRELRVINMNLDPERELMVARMGHTREVEKHLKYEERLREELEAAKKRTIKFEKFVLSRLKSESDRLSASTGSDHDRRRSSIALGGSATTFQSLMTESPDLDGYRPGSFSDSWDALEFSEENKQEAEIVRSASRMIFPQY